MDFRTKRWSERGRAGQLGVDCNVSGGSSSSLTSDVAPHGRMDTIPLNARSLSYRWNGRRYTIQFDDEHLTVKSDSPAYRIAKTPLWHLAPEFVVDNWWPNSVYANAKETRYLYAGAIVVFFSDISTQIPLLAPALLLLALLSSYRILRACWPLNKTRLFTEDDEQFTVIPHHRSQEAQRKAFEEALIRAIQKARDEYNAA